MGALIPVSGIDVVQDENGGFIVLRDHRNPSTVHYYPLALEATSGNICGVALRKVDHDGDYVELLSCPLADMLVKT